MTTWTVTDRDGDVLASGLALTDAAREILTYDGAGYEVRRADGYEVGGEPAWEVWTSAGQRGPLSKATTPMAWAPDAETAWLELAGHVVAASRNWRGAPVAMPDAEHARMLEDLAREAADDEDAAGPDVALVFFHSGSRDGSGMLPDTTGVEFPAPLDLAAVRRQAEAVVREALEAGNGEEDWSGWTCGAYLDSAQLLETPFPSKGAADD